MITCYVRVKYHMLQDVAGSTRLTIFREKQSFHKIVFCMIKKLANIC